MNNGFIFNPLNGLPNYLDINKLISKIDRLEKNIRILENRINILENKEIKPNKQEKETDMYMI